MKRLIIYDLDGTLVDTLEDIANAANHMLAELQRPPLPAAEIRRYIGRGLHELIKHCLNTTEPALLKRGTKISAPSTRNTFWIIAGSIRTPRRC